MTLRWMLAGCIAAVVPGASLAESAGCLPTEQSTVPATLYVVGQLTGGGADPAGRATVVVRDFARNPLANMQVSVDFSACCDIRLCSSTPGYDCETRTVHGWTDGTGAFTFTVLGAASDPGDRVPPDAYGGGGANAVVVRSGWCGTTPNLVIGHATAVALDQNGGAGISNGVTTSDVANLLNLYGAVGLGAPYRGRGDVNGDGAITTSDVAALLGHMGRLALAGGVGCPGALCEGAGCP